MIYFGFCMKEKQMITNVLRVNKELLLLSKRVQVCVCVTSRCLSASQPGKTHFTKRQNTDECSSAGRGAHIPAHTFIHYPELEFVTHAFITKHTASRVGVGGTLHWTYLFRRCSAKNKNRRRLKCHFDFLPDLFFNPLWSSSTCLLLLDAEQVKCTCFASGLNVGTFLSQIWSW